MDTKSIAAALETISQGFAALAVALDLPSPATPRTNPRTKDTPEEEPVDNLDKAKDPGSNDPVELADLQELGASLIRAGKREAFKGVMTKFKLKNLSSADPKDYPKIWTALTKAGE